jgi:uncharacterized protein (TIGR03435 family)
MFVSGLSLVACLDAVASAQVSAPAEFEVASIKPTSRTLSRDSYAGGYCRGIDTRPGSYPRLAAPTALGECRFTSVYLPALIRWAYASDVSFPAPLDFVTGGPAWLRTQRFDLLAKATNPSGTNDMTLRRMLQALLKDRFRLVVHFATKSSPGYGLYVSRSGPRLQASTSEEAPRIVGMTPPTPDQFLIVAQHASMRGLASSLSTLGIGPVVDRSAVDGAYDFRLLFARDSISTAKGRPLASPGDANSTAPTIFGAIEEQLGLRLVRERVAIQYIVVDAAVQPSEN